MTLELAPSSAVAITVQPAEASVPSDLKDLVPADALPRPFLYEGSNARAPCTYSELVQCLDGFAPSAGYGTSAHVVDLELNLREVPAPWVARTTKTCHLIF